MKYKTRVEREIRRKINERVRLKNSLADKRFESKSEKKLMSEREVKVAVLKRKNIKNGMTEEEAERRAREEVNRILPPTTEKANNTAGISFVKKR